MADRGGNHWPGSTWHPTFVFSPDRFCRCTQRGLGESVAVARSCTRIWSAVALGGGGVLRHVLVPTADDGALRFGWVGTRRETTTKGYEPRDPGGCS